MQIVCPHCTTSYAVDPAKFAPAGRSVRCARCQQVWLARPEPVAMAATAPDDDGDEYESSRDRSEWANDAAGDVQENDPPHIQSPSLAANWDNGTEQGHRETDDSLEWQDDGQSADSANDIQPTPPVQKGFAKISGKLFPARSKTKSRSALLTATRACVAMAALVFGVIYWRADIVRHVPNTADFFRLTGMAVNIRGLTFEDVRITTEMVGNKPVLVIQGAVVDRAHKSIDLPRLRFLVRDAQGADIYAWNAVLEQTVINPGEKVAFKSRLASPPAEGREIAVRFFQRRDIAAGGL